MLPDLPPLDLDPQPFGRLHWKGTAGAKDVRTPSFHKTRLALEDAYRVQGIVAIIGKPGLGKTHDCGLAIEDLGLPSAYYPVGVKPIGKEFEAGALQSLTRSYNLNNTRPVMKRDLAWAADRFPLVWTLDDVERAEGYGIELVRSVWARSANRFTIVLIGNSLMAFLDRNPAVRDRVARWVFYEPMTTEDSVGFARSYHAIYEHAGVGVVEYVDNEIAHGSARQWAQLTETILSSGFDPASDRLTRALADEAIARRIQL